MPEDTPVIVVGVLAVVALLALLFVVIADWLDTIPADPPWADDE